jgi:hypothetical protein
MNWIGDFGISEALHESAQRLSGVYSRMIFNNPEDPRHGDWEQQGLLWSNYLSTGIWRTEKGACARDAATEG